jgi:hypothetical protein
MAIASKTENMAIGKQPNKQTKQANQTSKPNK